MFYNKARSKREGENESDQSEANMAIELTMPLSEYKELRPRLVEILDEHGPMRVRDLHAKYMEAFQLDELDASHCLQRMLDDGGLDIDRHLKAVVGKFAYPNASA